VHGWLLALAVVQCDFPVGCGKLDRNRKKRFLTTGCARLIGTHDALLAAGFD
jgi:hypothetical protein